MQSEIMASYKTIMYQKKSTIQKQTQIMTL